jgi:hypothetical protein
MFRILQKLFEIVEALYRPPMRPTALGERSGITLAPGTRWY